MPSAWNLDIAGQRGQAGGPPGVAGVSGTGYGGTSTTNLPIATGSVTITTQAGLAYLPGMRVRIASNSDPTQWMEGICTAYSGTSLTMNVDLTNTSTPTPAAAVLFNYLGGLTLSNDTVSPNTVLAIATGSAASDDNSIMMTLAAANYKKNCNAAWAVGNNNGALDSGSALAASTWYHVFLIERPDTFIVDVLISTSATAPALPANYTKKRRLGSILTNASSQIIAFIQYGDKFLWRTPIEDYINATLPTTLSTMTLTVPLGVQTEANFSIYFSVSTAAYFTIWSPDQTGAGWNSPSGHITINGWGSGAVLTVYMSARTGLTRNLNYQASAAAPGFYITTHGWTDNRGK